MPSFDYSAFLTQAAADARYQALGSLSSSTPSTIDSSDTGSAGVSSSAARADHEHPVSGQLVPTAGWTSYTPTLTQSGAVTKTVNYAEYIQMGKTVIVNLHLRCTGSGTAANPILVGLPVAAASPSNLTALGTALIFDSSGGARYQCITALDTNLTVCFLATNSTANNLLGTGGAFGGALDVNDTISMNITYEAA